MRALALVVLMAGCGKKTTPEPPAPEPAPAPAPLPEPEPEVAPEPEPVQDPQARPSNTSFDAAIVWADGSTDKGHVRRVERTEDWYGDQGWTGEESDLKVTLEGNGTEIEAAWTDLTRIDITYAGSTDVDCSYDSAFDPAMYMCVLRTTAKAKTKDGKSWDVSDRHKWMFVFEGGPAPEFYVSKLPARKQEQGSEGLGATEQEAGIYEELQKELDAMKVGKVPKTITITAP